MKAVSTTLLAVVAAAVLAAPLVAEPPAAFKHKVDNDLSRCNGSQPAVKVLISGITPAHGMLRVQLYPATAADWLKPGRWLDRIEVPARGPTATVCMPVPGRGTYAIAVRHDVNGNGKTDIATDGGGMSNNPAINILNLGKPSVDKTAFAVGDEVKTISIHMRYF